MEHENSFRLTAEEAGALATVDFGLEERYCKHVTHVAMFLSIRLNVPVVIVEESIGDLEAVRGHLAQLEQERLDNMKLHSIPMTPAELYALEPVKIEYDLWNLKAHSYTHLDKIFEGELYELDHKSVEDEKRLEVRYYVSECPDGRRVWELGSAWFDGSPFMVIQNAGREGDDFYNRYVTDGEVAKKFGAYLNSKRTLVEEIEVVDPNEFLGEKLTSFYRHSMLQNKMNEHYKG